jgi:MHS family proline/betaine transporter-like MFS transporter
MPQPALSRPLHARRGRRAVIAAAIGNGLEIYDFTVYSFFAATIGRLFFPPAVPLASLLLSFATFGAGFVMRPLGAVLIGNMADRRGRKAALTLTIGLMTAGTALLAFTPAYASIGVTATALVVVGRLLQGLSAGGEVGAVGAADGVNWQAPALLRGELARRQPGRCGIAGRADRRGGVRAAEPRSAAVMGLARAVHARPADRAGRHLYPPASGRRPRPKHRPRQPRDVVRSIARTLLLGVLLMTSSTSSMYHHGVLHADLSGQHRTCRPSPRSWALRAGLTMLVMSPLFGCSRTAATPQAAADRQQHCRHQRDGAQLRAAVVWPGPAVDAGLHRVVGHVEFGRRRRGIGADDGIAATPSPRHRYVDHVQRGRPFSAASRRWWSRG